MDFPTEYLWRAFAVTGDPMAYVDYAQNRKTGVGFEGRRVENNKGKRAGS